MSRPVSILPSSLMRHGVRTAVDNLTEGDGIRVTGRELAQLFGLDVLMQLDIPTDESPSQ